MRVVIDNNVLVSAAIFRGLPRKTLNNLLLGGTLLASVATLRELTEVLDREKFDQYVPRRERLDFLTDFLNVVELTKITESIDICRDPNDNMLLELAISGDADFIVTGDKDLLVLNPFRGIEILTPRNFSEIVP